MPTHYLLEFESLGGGDKRSSRLPEVASEQNLFALFTPYISRVQFFLMYLKKQNIYTRNSPVIHVSNFPFFEVECIVVEIEYIILLRFLIYSYVYQISLYI